MINNQIKSKRKNGNNEKKKYILNTAEDVLKIPNETFYNIDISNFSGEYFKKIYQEALEVEEGKRKLKIIKPLNNKILSDIDKMDAFEFIIKRKIIEKKEKKEKKEIFEKKAKTSNNNENEGPYHTPTKVSKYTSIFQNKKLNYDSPIKDSNNKTSINDNNKSYITPDKNNNNNVIDSLGKVRQRIVIDYRKNNVANNKDKNVQVNNSLELMRQLNNKPRIKSEEKNTKLKKHRFEPLEIIFEDNSRNKKVISPEINIKRNSNSKFNRILYNLYNIKHNREIIHNHNNLNIKDNKIDNNKKYEKSLSTIFNEVKKRQRKKYYFSLLQKKINYLKQIKDNNKFNQKNITINLYNNFKNTIDNNNQGNNNSIQDYSNYQISNNPVQENININNEINNNQQEQNRNHDHNHGNHNHERKHHHHHHRHNHSSHNANYNNTLENISNNNNYNKNKVKHYKGITYNNDYNDHKINKILFYFKYNSNYGDNIGVLGSTDQLGNWCQDKILYLKWNYGNIWCNYIDVDNSNLENFEFKFIICHDGIIYWEKGYNYLVDFDSLIEEIKYHKKGRFNKYEYVYKIEDSELILQCKWNGWEWDINNETK